MTHADAWRRLPDLLDDRDDADLLAHVRACPECQRQLFLLGRVDRLLYESAAARRPPGRRPIARGLAAGVAVAAAAAIALVLVLPGQRTREYLLHTASGRLVGNARIGNSDGYNASLALTARNLPTGSGHMFVLWAGGQRSSIQVGEFMVDGSGGCRVRFNLPAMHTWHRFWVTEAGKATRIVAST